MRVPFSIFLVCWASPAFADDAGGKAQDGWSGFYVGATIGAGRATADTHGDSSYASDFSATDTGSSGLSNFITQRHETIDAGSSYSGSGQSDLTGIAGIHLGAAYQWDWLVVAGQLEYGRIDALMDVAGSGENHSRSHVTAVQSVDGGPYLPLQDDRSSSLDRYAYADQIELTWQTSALFKLGVLATPDVMLYGIVGATRAGFRDAPFTTRNGISAGAGVAYALAPNWLIFGEYLRTDFGSWEHQEATADTASSANFTQTQSFNSAQNIDVSVEAIRMGVSYRIAP